MNARSLTLACALALLATGAVAHDYTVGKIKIDHPWARATPKAAPVAGGYMTLTNNGTTPDRLIGGETDAAKSIEVHEMTMNNGIMRMRELKGGLEIKPGQTVVLKPGSYHIMFIGPKHQLKKGERVKATLKFEKAGPVNVEFDVESIAATKSDEHDTKKMDMNKMEMKH